MAAVLDYWLLVGLIAAAAMIAAGTGRPAIAWED